MARRRPRAGDSAPVSRHTLEEPFPSSPSRNPTHVLYCYHDDQVCIVTFAAAYAAKRFLDQVVDDQSYKWKDQHTILVEDGTRVQSQQIEELIEHEYSELEQEWILPDPYPRMIRSLKTSPRNRLEDREATPSKTPDQAPKEAKPPKEPKKPRASRDGLVSVGDIAAAMGCDPKEARGALRKAKVEKPDCGWAWPSSEVEKIKEIIKRGLK